jgi:hypothetical protein
MQTMPTKEEPVKGVVKQDERFPVMMNQWSLKS